jgi:hypothetical protein
MTKIGDDNRKEKVLKAEFCPVCLPCELAGDFDEKFKVSRNIRRRMLISPYLIAGSLKFPIFDNAVDEKTNNAINQGRNDGQLGNNGSSVKRTNGRLADDGKVFFKSAVGSLGNRTKCKQAAMPLGTSRNFKNKTWMLRDGNMRGIAKQLRTMRPRP